MKTFSDSDSSHSIDSSFGGCVEDCAVWEKVVMRKLVSTLESVLPTPAMGGMDIGVEVLCAVRMLMLENDRLRKLLGNVCSTCGSVNSPGECDVKFSGEGVTRTQSPSKIDPAPRHPTVMTSKVTCFATNHRPEALKEKHDSDTSDCKETNSRLPVSPRLVKGDLQPAENLDSHPEPETSLYLTDNQDDNKESELDPNHDSSTDRCHVARGPHFRKMKLHIAARWKETRRRQKFLLAFAESLMLAPTTSSYHDRGSEASKFTGSASIDDATAVSEGLDGDSASVASVDSNAYDSSTDSDSGSGSDDDTDSDGGGDCGSNSGSDSGTDISVDNTQSISHIAHHHHYDCSDVSDCSDGLNPLSHSQYAAYIHACNTASRSANFNTDCSDHATTTTHVATHNTTNHPTHSATDTACSTAEPDNAQFARDVRSVTQPLAALFDTCASRLRASGSDSGSGRAGNYGDAYVYELMDKVIVDQFASGGTTTNESRLAGLMEQLLRLERVVEQQLSIAEEG